MITRAVVTNPDEGSAAVAGAKRLRQVWLVSTDSAFDTAFDVMYATLDGAYWLPQVGERLYRLRYRPDDERYLPELVDAGNPALGYQLADPDVRATLVEPRRLADDPTTWEVAVTYESDNSPTADIPEVEFGKVRFQKHETADVRGMVLTNSAMDPFEGGVAVDRGRRSLTIARNVAYAAYDPVLTQQFEDTLNARPYTLGTLRKTVLAADPDFPAAALDPDRIAVFSPVTGLLVGYSVPLRVPPGMARLTELTGKRRVLARTPTVGGTTFYWQVTVQIEIDRSVFVDEHGQEQYTRWRKVLTDVGWNYLDDKGRHHRIVAGGGAEHGPALLDGRGRKLVPAGTDPASLKNPPVSVSEPIIDAGANRPWPRHVWYAGRQDQPFVVAKDRGLLTADGRRLRGTTAALASGGSPLHGSVAIAADGSFTYTPTSGYVGWDYFRFKLTSTEGAGAGESNPATALILVGRVPRVRVFDMDREADWDPIAPLIGGW